MFTERIKGIADMNIYGRFTRSWALHHQVRPVVKLLRLLELSEGSGRQLRGGKHALHVRQNSAALVRLSEHAASCIGVVRFSRASQARVPAADENKEAQVWPLSRPAAAACGRLRLAHSAALPEPGARDVHSTWRAGGPFRAVVVHDHPNLVWGPPSALERRSSA